MNAIEKNLRFIAGNVIGNSPILFPLNYYRGAYKEKIINPDSDCCIEGFQRSGSSFFVLLFKRANSYIKLAHHTHSSTQVIKAVGYKVPTMVLIRQPEDVIASLLALDSKLKVNVALGAYISFYRNILPYKKDFMIVDFEDVTETPALVVSEFNKRFDIRLTPPEFSEKRLNRIKGNIKKNKDVYMSPLPTAEKEKVKELFKSEIENNPKLVTANNLYKQFYEHRHVF